jgi:DNA-binding SARP family transcriptional activator/ABC-type lipoprotein export system ATPase subunit
LEITVLELKLLGVPELTWQGQVVTAPAPKPFAMLCYLAMQNEPCSRKDLAELLWEVGKTGSVRVALAELRNLSGSEEWLVTDDQLVRLEAVTDVKQFEAALTDEDYGRALEICAEAKTLFQKTLLKGLELRNTDNFMNWLELERSRLSELYLTALQGRISELEKQQKYPEAIKLARVLLGQDKLNEDVHRTVIRLEHKRGNDEAALAQFEQVRLILKEELDEEPLEETLELLREIEGGSVSKAKAALVLRDATTIPYKADRLFGREPILAEIQTQLQNGERILLQGLGGSGKTALAAAIAEGHLRTTTNGKVLWLQAGDDNPDALLDAVARAFDARQSLSQTQSKAKLVQDLLLKNKITLFVLDDVWNAYALSKLTEALPALQFVVTSRQRYPKLKRVDVGRLTREAAIQLLLHHAHALPPLEQPANENTTVIPTSELLGVARNDGGVPDADTNQLCQVLGDHAFAVRIAGITLAADHISAGDLLGRIKDTPHSLKLPGDFAEEGRESVSSLLGVSLAALSDEAHETLMGFGALATSSTTPELLALCLRRDEETTENALSELQKRGLAERMSEPGSDLVSYRLHDLVFSLAKANSNLRASTIMNACHSFLQKHTRHFAVLDVEISNLLGGVEIAKRQNVTRFVEMIRLLVVGDAYYAARGHSSRSFALHQAAAAKAKELGDVEAAHYLIARLGDTYRELYGELDKALEAFEEGLELARKLENVEREAILSSAIGIVLFYQHHQDSKKYLEKAHQIAVKHNLSLVLSQVLQYQGYVAGQTEEWQTSRDLSDQSIQLAVTLKKSSPTFTAEINANLFFSFLNWSEAERKLGNSQNALETCQKAIFIAQEQENLLWQAYALESAAEIYHELNDKVSAQNHYQKALELLYENNAFSDMDVLIQTMKTQGYKINEKEMVFA